MSENNGEKSAKLPQFHNHAKWREREMNGRSPEKRENNVALTWEESCDEERERKRESSVCWWGMRTKQTKKCCAGFFWPTALEITTFLGQFFGLLFTLIFGLQSANKQLSHVSKFFSKFFSEPFFELFLHISRRNKREFVKTNWASRILVN